MHERPTDVAIPQDVVERMQAARRIFVLTGAGVSAESGIETFRAPGTGLWSQYSPKEVATPEAWARDPVKVWSWYSYRRRGARRAQPNPAHLALAQLERRIPQFTLATQNVDGLHQRAGSVSVVELHGSLFRFRCVREGISVAYVEPDDEAPQATEHLETEEIMTQPPTCPDCGANVRPDIVWFGEALPVEPWQMAEDAASACDVCLVVGTSALVAPAAGLPRLARSHGAYLIEINPEATALTSLAHWSARERAGVALPALLAAIETSETSETSERQRVRIVPVRRRAGRIEQ